MMKIVLSEEALNWFKEEMDVESGDCVNFYARYGGSSPLHDGFSLGVKMDKPEEIAVQTEHDGILFYIESRDAWFFDGHDLHVQVDLQLNEPTYAYEKM